MAHIERPLSPHIQIYRPQITSAMSILHRITGVALAVGSMLLVWWLVAAATGPDYFKLAQGVLASWLGRLVMFGFTWALFYHLCNGIRHLAWDLGYGFDLPSVRRSGVLTLAASVVLTLLAWVLAYSWK